MGGIYWLASYPKSGNTWFRAFIRNLLDNGDSPADINELTTGAIASGRGWLDEVLGFDTADLTHNETDQLRPAVYRWALKDDEIGYHKIHDAYTYTKDGSPLVGTDSTLGALYIIRNPLDVATSNANHNGTTIDQAIERMGNPASCLASGRKGLPHQARQKLLTWSQHVLSWAEAPDLNCNIIRYEDILTDPMNTFSHAAAFLQLPTEPERIEKAIRFSEFKVLSQQESERGFKERPRLAKSFFNSGQSGSWRTKLTPEQIAKIIADHHKVMQRFGYLNDQGQPI